MRWFNRIRHIYIGMVCTSTVHTQKYLDKGVAALIVGKLYCFLSFENFVENA